MLSWFFLYRSCDTENGFSLYKYEPSFIGGKRMVIQNSEVQMTSKSNYSVTAKAKVQVSHPGGTRDNPEGELQEETGTPGSLQGSHRKGKHRRCIIQ